MKTLYWFVILLLLSSSAFSRSIFKVEGNNVIVTLDGIGVKSKILKVEMWSPSVVKVVSSMNETFSTTPSLIGERTTAPVKFKASYAQNIIEITTENLLINIEEDGRIRLLSRDGKKLLVESDRSFEPSTVAGAYKINQKFFLNTRQEHIYGMGQEDKESRFNLRGQSFDLHQTNSNIASPILFSEKGFALIWDNFSATKFSDAPSGLQLTSNVADEISYFFIYGPDWTHIVSEIRKATGKVPLLPRWAFGFWLNPTEYKTESELATAVNKYNSLGIPVEPVTSQEYYFLDEERQLTENSSSVDPKFINAAAYVVLKEKYKQLSNSVLDRRLCIPTHTNLPGVQQFGSFLVSGTISTCWESISAQVSAGVTSALSGQPYFSTAIGGTTPKENCTLTSANELLVRWYQFAALTPVFRGARDGKEIWQLGEKNNENFKAVENAIKLRYKLLPYIYSSASEVVFNNKSLMRSMIFDSLTNETIHEVEKQYMFGKSLMVCPVTTEGAKEIPVTFPAGNNWVDFFTGKVTNGGQTIKVPVTIKTIPVYVKQGSIIPISTIGNNSSDSLNAPLEIRVYPGRDGSFTLYEDAGDGKGYLQGQASRISFDYSEKNKTISIDAIEGNYPGMTIERVFNIVLVSEENGTGLTNATTKQEVQYKGKKLKIKL